MAVVYPDPLPFQLSILKALTDCLKTITPDNGYNTDLSDQAAGADGVVVPRVFRGRAWFGDSDPIPMVSILEAVSPADEVSEAPAVTSSGEYDWGILIQGFVNDDPENPTDPAYILKADVRKRLAIEKKRKTADHDPDVFGLGLKNRLTIQSIGIGVVRPADDLSAKAYFWMQLTLRVLEKPDA